MGSWEQWLDWILSRARDEKQFRTVYAHNGGGWDWLSLAEYLIEQTEYEFHTIQNGGTVIAIMVHLAERLTLRLVDSYRLLDCSLDAAGIKYVGEGKADTGGKTPEWLWKHNRKLYRTYIRQDTELLWKSLQVFGDIMFAKAGRIGSLGLTLPSTAMKVFRTEYLKQELTVPFNNDVRSFLREGYVGGRVEVFNAGYYRRINVYDVNSLYPSVMHDTRVPTSGEVQWTRRLFLDRCGCYRVRFRQDNRRRLPLLLVNGRGAYSGEGVYFTPELRRLVRDAAGTVEVIEGFVFSDESVLFREYVKNLYALRMTDKDGPLGDVCKKLMNSLYGKWAIKPERSETCRLDYDQLQDELQNGSKVEILSEKYGLYRVSREHSIIYEHVGIAGIITSEARARLWQSFDSGTVYCDTDSIHTTGILPVNAKKLGKLKHEFSGEGVYCGKKLYALRNKETEKVRVKGVKIARKTDSPERRKLGCRLDFDSVRSLLSGRRIVCRFRSAATANNVFTGKRACVMVEKSRTIRMTAPNGNRKQIRRRKCLD